MCCAVAASTQERPWLCWKPSASGKVKASPPVVALVAHSPLHIWFLKVFLIIFENKLVFLIFSMPYLVLGRSPNNSPRTVAEEQRLRKCCAKVSLSKHFPVCFLEATPGCGLQKEARQSSDCIPTHGDVWLFLAIRNTIFWSSGWVSSMTKL